MISFDEDKQMFPRQQHRVRRNHRSLNESNKSLNNSSESLYNNIEGYGRIESLNDNSDDKNNLIKSELSENGTQAASRKLQQLVDFDVPQVLGVPYITANIYCKSRNLPNTDIRIYSLDLR